MPLAKKIKTEIGLLGIWELTETVNALADGFQFTRNEKNQFGNLKLDKRKIEYLATRLLLEKMTGEMTEIFYHSSGKPYILTDGVFISISHSANAVAIILSNQNTGIDTENAGRNIARVANRFLGADELAQIENFPNPQSTKITFWCAKEAIFKCTDCSGIDFAKQIQIENLSVGNKAPFTGKLNVDNVTTYYKLWKITFKNNIVVYCVEDKKTDS